MYRSIHRTIHHNDLDTSHNHSIACRHRQQFRPSTPHTHLHLKPTPVHSTATPTAVQTICTHSTQPHPCAPSNHSCPHPHVKSTSQRGRLRGRGGPFVHVHTPNSHARTAHGTPARLAPAASYAPHVRCLTCYQYLQLPLTPLNAPTPRHGSCRALWLSRCRGCCLGCRAL